ncbi:type II secretion system protein [Solidesulfovibrio sp.]|uniref:type II secretion system protein n=1 Tax=Solidesulfovibrio sp. TaxID=2910990 RepID=UPI00262B9EC2|nr:type II secretion system protein [Solidesulfovibrio sp.]
MTRRFVSRGFTLLEVIMTFVILAIVCVVAVSSFTGGVTRTDVPVKQLQTDAKLQLVLENMISNWWLNYNNQLVAFNANIGNANVVSTKYGSGSSYVITQKQFVCPSGGSFVANPSSNQFLMVTIKPDANSGVSLTYLFNSSNNTCNTFGGS